ncbi:MAG TPA: alpha/beta hydrolase [Rubrobacter sp.]|nr:alpha/beta hydrolase [Rubrobacter sp.]
MKTIARLLAFLSVAASCLLYVRIRAPMNPLRGSLWILRLLAEAVTPLIALSATVAAALALLARSPVAMLSALLGAVTAVRDVRRVTAPHPGFAQAFGVAWELSIAPERQTGMLQRRWTWHLPAAPEPRWQRDVPFWTLPDADRRLLCDLWQPPRGVAPSGLALVYLHGGTWSLLDKDFFTRSFFRHLAAQGHVVMDVAYRLYPETDMLGMVADAKRAIAWMKSQGPAYGVNPERVVVAGGSAGGHLALLAAYTPRDGALTPDDASQTDLSVRAVISCYGPTDLRAYYDHTRQDTWDHPGQAPEARPPGPLIRGILGTSYERLGLGKTGAGGGAMEPLLGGRPETVPDLYALFSPTTHVQPGCPPTLLIQGKDDVIAPVTATNLLFEQLVAAGVPAVNIVFPHAEHGFDLVLPRWSPAAQAALYYEERFLALMT